MADSNFFSQGHDIIIQTVDSILSGELSTYSNMASSLAKFGISIYVLWYGYSVLARKQNTPVPDFIWNLARFALITTFITNFGGWLDSATSAIDGLKSTFAHGDPYNWMDQLWGKIRDLAALIMSKDESKWVKTDGSIGSVFVYLGGLVALLITLVVYCAAELTLKMLTVTSPLFIFCLMFGFLRQMFNSWLQLIFSSLFIFLFGSVALRAGIRFFNGIMTTSIATLNGDSGVNLIEAGATACAAGVIMAFVIWLAKTWASQIASVSADGAIQGAIAMGLGASTFGASKVAGSLLKGTGNFSKGAVNGIRGGKALETAQGSQRAFSQKVGEVTGQGMSKAAGSVKSVGKAAVETAKKRYGG